MQSWTEKLSHDVSRANADRQTLATIVIPKKLSVEGAVLKLKDFHTKRCSRISNTKQRKEFAETIKKTVEWIEENHTGVVVLAGAGNQKERYFWVIEAPASCSSFIYQHQTRFCPELFDTFSSHCPRYLVVISRSSKHHELYTVSQSLEPVLLRTGTDLEIRRTIKKAKNVIDVVRGCKTVEAAQLDIDAMEEEKVIKWTDKIGRDSLIVYGREAINAAMDCRLVKTLYSVEDRSSECVEKVVEFVSISPRCKSLTDYGGELAILYYPKTW